MCTAYIIIALVARESNPNPVIFVMRLRTRVIYTVNMIEKCLDSVRAAHFFSNECICFAKSLKTLGLNSAFEVQTGKVYARSSLLCPTVHSNCVSQTTGYSKQSEVELSSHQGPL